VGKSKPSEAFLIFSNEISKGNVLWLGCLCCTIAGLLSGSLGHHGQTTYHLALQKASIGGISFVVFGNHGIAGRYRSRSLPFFTGIVSWEHAWIML
jgi:hypothetical protein